MITYLAATLICSQKAPIPRWDMGKHLGKTSSEVVAMGFDKWQELQPVAAIDADGSETVKSFTLALRIENAKFALTKSKSRQQWIEKARRLSTDLAGCSNNLGYLVKPHLVDKLEATFSYFDVELAIRRWLSQQPPKKRPARALKELFNSLSYTPDTYDPHYSEDAKILRAINLRKQAVIGAHKVLLKHVQTGTKTDLRTYLLLLDQLAAFS